MTPEQRVRIALGLHDLACEMAQDNIAEAQAVFRDKFQTDQELVPSLLKVDSQNRQANTHAKP